jgi:hypothetical protein
MFLWVICNSWNGLIGSFLFLCGMARLPTDRYREILYWLFLQKYFFFLKRVLGMNIGINALRTVCMLVLCVKKHSLYIVASVRMPVMYVVRQSVRRLMWKNICIYILASVRMPVMCVIRHSVGILIFRRTSLYVVDSVLFRVMCVKKHSVAILAWRHTILYIMASIHMPVICVMKHLLLSVTSRYTS